MGNWLSGKRATCPGVMLLAPGPAPVPSGRRPRAGPAAARRRQAPGLAQGDTVAVPDTQPDDGPLRGSHRVAGPASSPAVSCLAGRGGHPEQLAVPADHHLAALDLGDPLGGSEVVAAG